MTFDNELDFERALIEKLTSNFGWSPVILKNKTEKELIQNWADILYRNNRAIDRLGDYPLTESEMAQIIEQVNTLRTPVKLNTFINGKSISIKRENPDDVAHFGKEVSLKIYDRMEIGGGNSCYQIAEQPIFNTTNSMTSNRRGDLMLLINGMPFIHIELKKSGVPVSQACEQIKKYAQEGIFAHGLFSLVQVFVAMNPEETLYFANPGQEGKFRKEFFFHWADWNNEPINRWAEVAETLLSIPMAHELIGFYTIADNTDNTLKVMRSYQYFATKMIVDQATKVQWDFPEVRGGYIYHTTGSGKTMTSFKAAQIIAESGYADKVVFLMDRIELGTQSLQAYRNFAGDLVSVQATEDTDELVTRLKSDNRNDGLIVTSHQKMCRIGDDLRNRSKDIEKINEKHIVLIVDEAHRDVFGDMFSSIKETFPKAVRFGFTGTPIIKDNSKNGSTTTDVFGRELHRYSIADGIRDKNVLGFHAIPVLVYPEKKLRRQVALEKARVSSYEEAMADETKKEIFFKFDRDLPMGYVIGQDGKRQSGVEDYLPKSQYANDEYYKAVVSDIKNSWETLSSCSKFHAIFATSSIPEAIGYYDLIREAMPELKVTAIFDPSVDNNGNGSFKEDSIVRILSDYNDVFGKQFTIPKYQAFKKDATQRLAHKETYVGIDNDRSKQIDMVIVVDQLLTGFDSKWINTLYMDKVQENENIIQSFSRTNRLFNNLDKPFGTIKYYRLPFTMKANVETAVRNYSGDRPFGVFVSKLETQLNGMNQKFDEIKMVFDGAGIVDFSRLPDGEIDKKKFSELFKSFSEYLASAKVQDFKWTQNEYSFVCDDGTESSVTVHLDESTYLILLQRYKELSNGEKGGSETDAPYDIDPNITEIDTELIDTEYMNSRFVKYLKMIKKGADDSTLSDVLAELHRSFAMLSQDEQKFAKVFLGDIQSGNVQVEEGKSFRDYITEYQTRHQDDEIHRFANNLGMDESLLRLIVREKTNYSDINSFGRLDALLDTVDKQKAKDYLEELTGEAIPMRKLKIKIDSLIRSFIEHN
ncbi:MAG: type I restriction endonuclease subunit R [Spirochaetales bacterium]|nr:type I restriction endonuclease subunit R [Spirochaetales bacterium]